jgi:putative peptide zinc metalloprotease protein
MPNVAGSSCLPGLPGFIDWFFLGIAALVYHFFIKALGILLFLVEIVWFIAKPLWSEIAAWYLRWPQIVRSRRARWSAIGAFVLVALCWLPLPAPIRTEGMLQSSEIWPLHALDASQLQQQMFGDARMVEVDAPVFMLDSPALKAAQAQNDAQRTQYSQQIAAAGFDSELRRTGRFCKSVSCRRPLNSRRWKPKPVATV